MKLINQPPKVMFETVCRYSGVNFVFDPDYQPGKNLTLELNGSTIGQSLDYIAAATRS